MLALAVFVACVPPALLHFLGREAVHFGNGLHSGLVLLHATAATGTAPLRPARRNRVRERGAGRRALVAREHGVLLAVAV